MSKKKCYEVRVIRHYEEEYVDLEIEARSPEEARKLAREEAVANNALYFGPTPDPWYNPDEAIVLAVPDRHSRKPRALRGSRVARSGR